MHNEFAKWETKTRLFSRQKSLAGNCCLYVADCKLATAENMAYRRT